MLKTGIIILMMLISFPVMAGNGIGSLEPGDNAVLTNIKMQSVV